MNKRLITSERRGQVPSIMYAGCPGSQSTSSAIRQLIQYANNLEISFLR